MNRFTIVFFALVLTVMATLPLVAQDKPAFIADFLGQVEYVQGQIMSLEDAVPHGKEVPMNEVLADIAKRVLNVETLETRKMDSLDFHDVAVWQLKKA